MIPSRLRECLASALGTTLLLASGCSGGSETNGLQPHPSRDAPPAVREAPGRTRESPGATRESPGSGREQPSGGTTEPPGSGTGCLLCPQSYDCTITSGNQSRHQALDLEASGGECMLSGTTGTVVFHCDGTLTLSGDSVGTASGWHLTGNGGFVVDGNDTVLRCRLPSATPTTNGP